jgi:hypothetical protein
MENFGIFSKASLVALLSLAASNTGTAAELGCYFFDKVEFCSLDYVPKLDQTFKELDPWLLPNGPKNSKICVPTAIATALATVLANSWVGVKPDSWLEQHLPDSGAPHLARAALYLGTNYEGINRRYSDFLLNLARLIGTEPKDLALSTRGLRLPGTLSTVGLIDLASQFKDGETSTMPGYLLGNFPTAEDHEYIAAIGGARTGGRPAAGVLTYLSFRKDCTGPRWFKICIWHPIFEAHALAMVGHFKGKLTFANKGVLIQDPWLGRQRSAGIQGAGVNLLSSKAKRIRFQEDEGNVHFVINSARFLGVN